MSMFLPFTTGLSFLPEPGGLMDQPERLMAFFEAFMEGDQEGLQNRMRKK